MKASLHKSAERFNTKIDWLDARHYFSFGGHFDPNRISFGALLVVNDDIIKAHSGFDTHPHRDMEIITIPFAGTLSHKDSSGGVGQTSAGEVQTMTAGTGIAHSEFNDGDVDVHSFQIWILPHTRGLAPGYAQKAFAKEAGSATLLVSPDGRSGSLPINQDAYIWRLPLASGTTVSHKPVSGTIYEVNKDIPMGTFIICISGYVSIDGADDALEPGDWVEITEMADSEDIKITSATEPSEALILQVPMINLNQ